GRVRAKRTGKRRIDGNLLADKRGGNLVEAQPTVGLRNLETQQIDRRRLAQQFAGQIPVVRVNARLAWQDLVAHELGRRATEHALFFAQILTREDVLGTDAMDQKLTAGNRLLG